MVFVVVFGLKTSVELIEWLSEWRSTTQNTFEHRKEICFRFFFQCGTVWINCWMLRDLRAPFGGIKDSGIGREGYPYSEEVFTELKTITLNIS